MISVLAVVGVAEVVDRAADAPGGLGHESFLGMLFDVVYRENAHVVDIGPSASTVFKFHGAPVLQIDLRELLTGARRG